MRLLAPITLVGRTALSLETSTKRFSSAARAAARAAWVQRMLLSRQLQGLLSTSGTCL